jgi:hypothetical protein
MTGGERGALPGERCTCGRPAVDVLASTRSGEVGWCGQGDGCRQGPRAVCGLDAGHDSRRCLNDTRRPTHVADDPEPA